MTDTREAIARAFEAGASLVHQEWLEAAERGDGPPRGDPEFGEYARDYAAAILSTEAAPSEPVRTGIYIASKTKHADRWRFLRDKVGEPIISTWIDEAGVGETSDFNDLWRRCIAEASSCRLLIAYREKDEVLKGGWVEIGAALAAGIPVFAVGLEDFTIAKYRGITHFASMKDAIAASRAHPATTKSAPATGASQNTAERDPSVMPDCAGAGTKLGGE